ncbi:MAG TPA: class I SAM-dependent methyltransferase [Solirubrobacteraceae bacterium]|nr:class I SAM-dependent methyltransferase [Solirubrobacteraceae bacterium]
MNPIHNVICSSRRWRRSVERELLPWGLDGVELGSRVLEVGPGFGATTRVLVKRLGRLDVLELDSRYCERLRIQFGSRAIVKQGDATSMPYPDREFSAVVCFTMLHHIPTRQGQDQAFAQAARVLAPGGVFAGTDSLGQGRWFKLIHIGDTMNLIDPRELPGRLEAAGFQEPVIECGERAFRFRARVPGG